MPRRPARALQTAYTTGAILLALTAIQHAADGQWPQAVAANALTFLLINAAVRESEYARVRHQLRAAIEEQTTRDARIANSAHLKAQYEAAWLDLYATCCLPAWASRGTEHDPATCTRTENP